MTESYLIAKFTQTEFHPPEPDLALIQAIATLSQAKHIESNERTIAPNLDHERER